MKFGSALTGWLVLIALVGSVANTIAGVPVPYLAQLKRAEQVVAAPDDFKFPPDGRPWIIVIFKPCCAPNTMAVKWSASLEKQWGDSLGILGIDIDSPKSIGKVRSWMRGHGAIYPVLWDANHELRGVIGVKASPMVILLSREGSEVFRSSWFNWFDAKKIEEMIDIDLKKSGTP